MYQDKYGRYHDKPTDGVEPSSNNGWIYTAYAKQIGLDVDMDKLRECYEQCLVDSSSYKINRSPNKLTPPLSKDEVVGLISLGLIDYDKLEKQNFTYCNLPNFKGKKLIQINWFKAIYQLIKLANEHRNTIWEEEGYEEAMQVAFRLKPDNIYYLKKMYGKKTNLFEDIFFKVSSFITRSGDNNSTKNIDSLQRHDLGLDYDKGAMLTTYIAYFGTEHPFVKFLLKD